MALSYLSIVLLIIVQCQILPFVVGKGYIELSSLTAVCITGHASLMRDNGWFIWDFYVKPRTLRYKLKAKLDEGDRTKTYLAVGKVNGTYEGSPIGTYIRFFVLAADGTNIRQIQSYTVTKQSWYAERRPSTCWFYGYIKFKCVDDYYPEPECTTYCKRSWTVKNCTEKGEAICKPGYTGGQNCSVMIDMCAKKNCEKGSVCQNVDGPDAVTAKCIRDLCYHNSTLCKNGGTCHMTEDNYRCQCTQFFYGRGCELDVNECKIPNFCENNGVCKNSFGGYKCTCPPFMSGPRCRYNNDICTSTRLPFCRHGGTCKNDGGSLSCICRPNFSGKHCELYDTKTAVYGPVIAAFLTVFLSLIFLFLLMIFFVFYKRIHF